jgi:hypothetical protein
VAQPRHPLAILRAMTGVILALPAGAFLAFAAFYGALGGAILPGISPLLAQLNGLPAPVSAGVLFAMGFALLVLGMWLGRRVSSDWLGGGYYDQVRQRKPKDFIAGLVGVLVSGLGFVLVLFAAVKFLVLVRGGPDFALQDVGFHGPAHPATAGLAIGVAAVILLVGLLMLVRADWTNLAVQLGVVVGGFLAFTIMGSHSMRSLVPYILDGDWTGLRAAMAQRAFLVVLFVPLALIAYGWVSYQAWRRHKQGPPPKPLVFGG